MSFLSSEFSPEFLRAAFEADAALQFVCGGADFWAAYCGMAR